MGYSKVKTVCASGMVLLDSGTIEVVRPDGSWEWEQIEKQRKTSH